MSNVEVDFYVNTYNNISPAGLAHLGDRVALDQSPQPDAILCRSQLLQADDLPASALAIARAGSGTNNIPIDVCTKRGIVVFNTPGANANAVKELVLAAMITAKRHLIAAAQFTNEIQVSDLDVTKTIEAGKKAYAGSELVSSTLGVVGLGDIGVEVANAASSLGMRVIGYDPHISVEHSWQLSSVVERANSLEQLAQQVDMLSIHVPLLETTKHLINAEILKQLPPHALLFNFSRAPLVDNNALEQALANEALAMYVCDFPDKRWHGNSRVIAFPHIGASTKEAEVNCARMAAEQCLAYLTLGSIKHSVNFPSIELGLIAHYRLAVINQNIPTMVSQISQVLADYKVNIDQLYNCSRDQIAYTVMDISVKPTTAMLEKLTAIEGVMRVRLLAG